MVLAQILVISFSFKWYWMERRWRSNYCSFRRSKKFVWMRVARGYQLRVLRKDNQVHKFDGFHSEDLDALKDAIKIFYKLPIDTKETSVKGWNWG
ncbi:unnamed protein product [Cunninghamella echinulata]